MKENFRLGIYGSLGLLLCAATVAALLLINNRLAPEISDPPLEIDAAIIDPGGPFALVDHQGKSVTDRDFLGRYLLVNFGYTFCPDICPTTLGQITVAMDLLGENANKVQPVFITVDPERDSIEVLARYMNFFHPQLIGLTGSSDQIANVARVYMVHYAQAERVEEASYYSVDHSSFIYLMGPEGEFRDVIAYGTLPQEMASLIERHISNDSSASGDGQ